MTAEREFGRWLDLDFGSESTRTGNFTGCNPNEAPVGTFRACFEDRYGAELIPKSDWKELIERKNSEQSWMSELIARVFNQGQEGACVADTAAQQHEICQSLQFGLDRVIHLSAISLYKRTGSSPGSGSTLDDNIREIMETGILPLDDEANKKRFNHCMPNTGFRLPFPGGWQHTAELFRGHEYLDIRSWEGLATCIFNGYPVMYARDGHCITGVRLFLDQGRFLLGYCNSWGPWGDQLNSLFPYGMGYDSESKASRAAPGAVCMRSVRSPQYALAL